MRIELKTNLNLEEGYKNAYDSGDKDKLLEAQKAIADATTELRMVEAERFYICLLYTSPSPRDRQKSRMPSSA